MGKGYHSSTHYNIHVLCLICSLCSSWKNTYGDKGQTLKKLSSTTTYLPFQPPIIKNAKVVKLELNPFLQNIISHYTQPLPFENEPHTIETIPLIREHLDTYFFYIRYKVLTITAEYPAFQISFPQQRLNSSHIYRRTINPINLQVPIKQIFHAFLNNVKDHNLAHEIPKFSPIALDDLQRYINNFDVEIIER